MGLTGRWTLDALFARTLRMICENNKEDATDVGSNYSPDSRICFGEMGMVRPGSSVGMTVSVSTAQDTRFSGSRPYSCASPLIMLVS